MRLIPFREPPQWREQIQLSGTIYFLRFRWNALNEFWSMDVLTADESPIVLGVKIVNNWNLLEQYSMLEKPLGEILCQSVIGSFEKLKRYDMTIASQLVYYEENELEQL